MSCDCSSFCMNEVLIGRAFLFWVVSGSDDSVCLLACHHLLHAGMATNVVESADLSLEIYFDWFADFVRCI